MTPDDSRPSDPAAPAPREVRLTPVMDDSVAEGAYANIATIIVGPHEFFLDFGRVVPGRREFRVFSRVILSPAHAKSLAQALTENVRRYEQAHGTIAGLPSTPVPGDGRHH